MEEVMNGYRFIVYDSKTNSRSFITINEEEKTRIFEKILFSGLCDERTKEDTLNHYFKLVEKSTSHEEISKENINVNQNILLNTLNSLKPLISERISFDFSKENLLKSRDRVYASLKNLLSKKISIDIPKREVIILSLLLGTGLISSVQIKSSIDTTRDHYDLRKAIVTLTEDKLKEDDVIEEVIIGKKGDYQIKNSINYGDILDHDITPLEAFSYITLFRDMYNNDIVTEKMVTDSFIQRQTYNGNYYRGWDDYLEVNGFSNEKEFFDYCYKNLHNQSSRQLKRILN